MHILAHARMMMEYLCRLPGVKSSMHFLRQQLCQLHCASNPPLEGVQAGFELTSFSLRQYISFAAVLLMVVRSPDGVSSPAASLMLPTLLLFQLKLGLETDCKMLRYQTTRLPACRGPLLSTGKDLANKQQCPSMPSSLRLARPRSKLKILTLNAQVT